MTAASDRAAVPTCAEDIAAAFVAARRAARPLAAYPGDLPASLTQAYAIQDAAIAADGRRVAGWKVGRIRPPLDAHYGVDRLAGPVFADQLRASDGAGIAMPVFAGGFGAVEAEFIAVLGDIPAGRTDWSLADAAAAITAVHIGIEIASSPLAAINDLGPAVTASDFGNNHGLILGPAVPGWQDAGLDDWPVSMAVDGAAVGEGRAADFPDGIVGAVRFLLALLGRRGIAVPAGTLVSTGAVSGVHQVVPGQAAVADFAGRARIACTITAAQPQAE